MCVSFESACKYAIHIFTISKPRLLYKRKKNLFQTTVEISSKPWLLLAS